MVFYLRIEGSNRDFRRTYNAANGVGEETVLLDSPASKATGAWSSDMRYFAYSIETNSGKGRDIYILPLFGDRKPFAIVQSTGRNIFPAFSFDGKWLAYQSDGLDTNQIYVIPFPGPGPKHRISVDGGIQPRWRRDGKELYYFSLDGKLMAVDITGGSVIVSGTPHELFDTKLNILLPHFRIYSATPDGKRFLLLKPLAEATPTPITIVLN
jgi:eukaryotic-like serine/threonine-protein kinase